MLGATSPALLPYRGSLKSLPRRYDFRPTHFSMHTHPRVSTASILPLERQRTSISHIYPYFVNLSEANSNHDTEDSTATDA